MSNTVEVKFFNSFLLKKTIKGLDTPALWCGDGANPDFYPPFPIEVDTTLSAKSWYIEESRIFGGFNEAEADLGVRAYLLDDRDTSKRLESSLIFSGIFNSRTSVNETNIFSVAEDITKSVDPINGSIERLVSTDSNLTIMQESKINSALIDKDAIYTSEGSRDITTSDKFIGNISQYSGNFGVGQFAESVAVGSNRIYFADVPNAAVLRLSVDGLTEISKYGMEDYFRDEFKQLSSELKRVVVDILWEVPWDLTTDTITVSGDNIDFIEYGMGVEGIVGESNLYIIDIGTEVGGEIDITLNKTISNPSSPQQNAIQLIKLVKDRVVGGFDNNGENYVLSSIYNPPSRSTESGFTVSPIENNLEP